MTNFKATANKKDDLKWGIYILIGVGLLIYIIKYSDWHFISKFLFSVPIIINLLFDFRYFKKSRTLITELNFKSSELGIVDNKKVKKEIPFSNLKYSIRKRKFENEKTEIELKSKNKFNFKTFGRLHIKNWENIFEIENKLNDVGVKRVEWKPMTLWGKYWGIFIDLIFLVFGEGDVGTTEYQEKQIEETTKNPINKNNA